MNQFQHFWYGIKPEIVVIQTIQLVVKKIQMMQFYMQIESIYLIFFHIAHICVLRVRYILSTTIESSVGNDTTERDDTTTQFCDIFDVVKSEFVVFGASKALFDGTKYVFS